MALIADTFWLPRRGNSPAEYEDAWAANPGLGRYAAADGASEGCFTGLWARLLVEDFVEQGHQGVEPWATALPAIQEQWNADVQGRNLPYHAQPGVRRGAFAAFLGLAFAASEGTGYQWQAIAVGDTCLFHTHQAALLRAFPLEDSHQFTNAPKLVGARSSTEDILRRCQVWPDGRGQSGDYLWLMTDAMAQWCLAAEEGGEKPWEEMESLLAAQPDDQRFAAWIDELRSRRGLRNDDVTLMAIRLKE